MSDLYHYFEGNLLNHVQANVIVAIGFPKYKAWKKIDKLFHVGCSMTATDLMIEIRSTLKKYEVNRWYYDHLAKEWGVDDNYLCVYCQHRGIEFHVKRGEFVAHVTVDAGKRMHSDNPHSLAGIFDHHITGHGPSLIMAIANLHYELSVGLNKTFIPS